MAKTKSTSAALDERTTKGRIERAALKLFVDQGVDGVSIKEIAKAANISEGAMYRHYPSKYKLAETLMLTIHNRLTALVRTIAANTDPIKAQIEALVTQYCALADKDWDLFAYHLLHLHHFPTLFTKVGRKKPLDSPVTACADLLRAAMDKGEIPPGNSELLSNMALGVVLQSAQAKVYGRLSGPLWVYSAEFNTAVLAILRQK